MKRVSHAGDPVNVGAPGVLPAGKRGPMQGRALGKSSENHHCVLGGGEKGATQPVLGGVLDIKRQEKYLAQLRLGGVGFY